MPRLSTEAHSVLPRHGTLTCRARSSFQTPRLLVLNFRLPTDELIPRSCTTADPSPGVLAFPTQLCLASVVLHLCACCFVKGEARFRVARFAMLSIGEVHNMGLARGFRPESLYGRDAFGLEAAALEAASGNVGLQQHMNDLISNSFLHSPLQQQQQQHSYIQPGSGDLYTSMGFSQSDNFLLDDLPPVVDHNHHHPAFVTVAPPATAVVNSTGFCAISNPFQDVQSLSPQQWVDEKLPILSPRGLKRDADVDHSLGQPPRKKLDRSARTFDTKSKRPATEQAGDHILRERQRRDDMTNKFAVLESLLPIGVKRDRSTIVDDSIEFVKNLHHRIKSLQERKVELNQASNQKTACRRGPIEVLQSRHRSSSPTEKKAAPVVTGRPRVSEEELKGIHAVLRNCVEKMEVHADLPHQVVIEMVCRQQPRLQSNILLCMEGLNLDVTQCTITKIFHRLLCTITAKPQAENTSGIVAVLKHALQR